MISSLIKDKIRVDYEYPSKFGIMSGRSIITSYNDSRNIKINDYLLTIDKFITLKIEILYCHITHSSTDD